MGPVWCYWAYAMERYCGTLQPAIRSRHYPFRSIDRWVIESAQLTQIKVLYNATEPLSLRKPKSLNPSGSRVSEYCGFFSCPYKATACADRCSSDPTTSLLPPSRPGQLDTGLLRKIAGALVTRFDIQEGFAKSKVQTHIKNSRIERWAQLRTLDSSEGDIMNTADLGQTRDDSRDATFVRVSFPAFVFCTDSRSLTEQPLTVSSFPRYL